MSPLSTVTLAGESVSSFLYADDIALVAKDKTSLQRMLGRAEEISTTYGFQFNPSKCEVVGDREISVTLYGTDLKQSPKFKYLGLQMGPHGLLPQESMERNIENSKKAIREFSRIGFRLGGLRERTKILLYKVFIRPKMEYGLSVLPNTCQVIQQLESLQYQALWTMTSQKQGYPGAVLRALSCVQTMRCRAEELKGKWFLHAQNAKYGSFMIGLARKAFETKPIRRSCFWGCPKNELVLASQREKLVSFANKTRRLPLHMLRLQIRIRHLEEDVQQCPKPGALRVEADFKPRQLYEMSSLPFAMKKLILKWIGNRAIGLTIQCPKCLQYGRQSHWDSCFLLTDCEEMIKDGLYARAHNSIRQVVDLYRSLKPNPGLTCGIPINAKQARGPNPHLPTESGHT
jgi:hypothetical protein